MEDQGLSRDWETIPNSNVGEGDKDPGSVEELHKSLKQLEQAFKSLSASVASQVQPGANVRPRGLGGAENGMGHFSQDEIFKLAQRRCRFDPKDAHNSILAWDHFFDLYNVTSDITKFYIIEQILPFQLQKSLATRQSFQISYEWLKSYLQQRYDPIFQCHNMALRQISRNSNINELEDAAIEAASCPRDHLIKHFMLESCPIFIKKQMRSYLLLSLTEFKTKLKSLFQEDYNRFHQSDPTHHGMVRPTQGLRGRPLGQGRQMGHNQGEAWRVRDRAPVHNSHLMGRDRHSYDNTSRPHFNQLSNSFPQAQANHRDSIAAPAGARDGNQGSRPSGVEVRGRQGNGVA